MSSHYRAISKIAIVIIVVVVIIVAAGIATYFYALAPSTHPKSSVNVTYGEVPIAFQAPIFAALDKGYFAQEGINLTLVKFQSGPAVVPAMEGGSVDVSPLGMTGAIVAGAQGLPIVDVADALLSTPQYPTVFLVTLKNSSVNSISDLKGLTIGTNSLGSVEEVVMGLLLKNNGMNFTDVHFAVVPFPSQESALLKGQIQAALTVEPFYTSMTQAGIIKTLADSSQALPYYQNSIMAFSKPFATQNPQVVVNFLKAYVKGVQAAQANQTYAREITAKYLGVPTAVALSWHWYAWNSQGLLNLTSIQLITNEMVQIGVLSNPAPLSSYINQTYIYKANGLTLTTTS